MKRMTTTMAARRGIASVTREAAISPLVLTSHGRPVAVVKSAAQEDAAALKIREAALAVVDAAAELVWERSVKTPFADVYRRLGIDEDAVRARAAELANQATR